MEDGSMVGIVVPTWNRAASAARCLAAIAHASDANRCTVVVDNGSRPAERDALAAAAAARDRVDVIRLPVNRGFAAAVNVGLEAVFARDVAAALVVNDDAELEPGTLAALRAHAERDPGAGIIAPIVLDADTGEEVSRGERVVLPLVCLPRRWLRVRGWAIAPYEVSGVLGVAFLITRECFAQVGPLSEEFFAYYEEVEYWLRARAAGVRLVVVPAARVRHAGFRGFAAGFSPIAAYLKARNLPLLMRRRRAVASWLAFVPTYASLLAASLAVYAARGQWDVVRALVRGVADGLLGRSGPPPAAVLATVPTREDAPARALP
jgi:GT2 family glycosyltransferase